jgi:hypothetical protein
MAVEYKEMINFGLDPYTPSASNIMRVIWHLYKFFEASTQFSIQGFGGTTISPISSWPATEDDMAAKPGAYFVIAPKVGASYTMYPGSADKTWELFIGATTYDTDIGPYNTSGAGLYVAFNGMFDTTDITTGWAPLIDDWGASAVPTDLMNVVNDSDADNILHLMQIHTDGITVYFGLCTETGVTAYFEQNKGCMAGYYKNPLPVSGAAPVQEYPGMVFVGYPTVTNANPSWAYAPTAPATYGYVVNYANTGYDRCRLTYFYGQTTSYMRGRKPGTFVNMPIPIYGLQPGGNTVNYMAGFTTLVLATSLDRAWFTTDGNRRNLVRISVPNSGTEITY